MSGAKSKPLRSMSSEGDCETVVAGDWGPNWSVGWRIDSKVRSISVASGPMAVNCERVSVSSWLWLPFWTGCRGARRCCISSLWLSMSGSLSGCILWLSASRTEHSSRLGRLIARLCSCSACFLFIWRWRRSGREKVAWHKSHGRDPSFRERECRAECRLRFSCRVKRRRQTRH